MARLSRNDVADISPDTGAQRTAEDIEQELRGAPPRTIPTAKRLPLDRIHVAEEVLQWRLATEDVGGKTGHTLALAQALEDNKKGLDPLVVWWGGSRFYLIEGHHRLAAYRTAKWSKPVPVIEFQGTLEEARLHALGGNVKDKLRMTGTEKSEAAWKLIKEKDRLFRGLKETKQVEEIATRATRGESTVWLMIKVWRAIQEQGADEDMTWGER